MKILFELKVVKYINEEEEKNHVDSLNKSNKGWVIKERYMSEDVINANDVYDIGRDKNGLHSVLHSGLQSGLQQKPVIVWEKVSGTPKVRD